MGARTPGCHAGRALSPAPTAVQAPGERVHNVARPHARGTATQNKSLHASERDTERAQHARARYWQRIAALDPRRLQFVDASGVNLALTRLYGRAPRGARVIGAVPQNYGQHVTMLGAVGADGSQAVMTVEGAPDTEVFRTYVQQVLGPSLAPGEVVVLDNLGVHKAVGMQQMRARRRARWRYLPPSSPDLSPIEPCWGKVKVSLRKAKARTCDALDMAITQAWALITATDARSWFMHCGYTLQSLANRSSCG
jgi:transposase